MSSDPTVPTGPAAVSTGVPAGVGDPVSTVPTVPGTGATGPAGTPADGTLPGAAAGSGRSGGGATVRPLDLLHGVEMAVTVELGRTRVLVRELLSLRAGSIIELDRPAGGAVDVVVNGTLLARGEVVVVDDELGVRITEVVGRDEEL
jgi:flagellar motor switch protein FliN/FliY